MGMTFWLHIRNDRKIEGNKKDLSALYNAAKAIDKVCQEIGVKKISAFQDETDLTYNMKAEFEDDEEEEEPATDPATGWPYSIDEMRWFDTADGLRTFVGLDQRLQTAAGLPGPVATSRERLVGEIRECITQLAAAPQSKFHLAVIM